MTENKDKQPAAEEKAKERNWISASLWADKEDIRKGAERYGEVKWYKSARFWPSMLVLILTWIGAAVTGSYLEAVGVSVILCPLCYLNVKGYRWSLLLFAALYTFDRVSVLYMRAESGQASGSGLWWLLIWWLVIVGATLTAFRIENYRHKHNLAGRGHYVKDTLIALAFPVVLIASFMAYNIFMYKSSLTDEQRKALAFSYGFISRNTDGVINYCLGSGVELQKFPEQFRQTYADEITKVNDWLEKDEIFKSGMEASLQENKEMLYEVFENGRKDLIRLTIAEETGEKPENLVWKTEYDRMISPVEYCKLMDESFEIMNSTGFFDSFVETVKTLQ